MIDISKKAFFFAAVFLCSIVKSYGQYVVFMPMEYFTKILAREEIGYGYAISNATYKFKSMGNNGLPDTSISQNVTSKAGFTEHVGYTFPISKLGDRSRLGMDIGCNVNLFTWDYKTPTVMTNSDGRPYYSFTENEFDFETISGQIEMPISLDARFGNLAYYTKDRFGWAVGAGISPMIGFATDNNSAGFGFGANPFIKAEVCLFAGIAMKLRSQVSFGRIPFYDENKSISYDISGYNTSSSLTGHVQASVTLVVLPFSWLWAEKGWWNTY
ncbi:hypothetical protein F0919_15200 [Taibaiella lutea]|uniref:Outer membrane protein beta-barrel domain-containing protein n=1 Tax=Taibaiella lutea TaxID=2608001 RepID=A0A5M6CFC0_9BACT|nr:hypothetical protein [Taibaiella lutea]KAA5532145.1 hypothetical protein F0919_15200 [Taibaiella lutea]